MNYALHIIAFAAVMIPSVLGLNLILGRGKILHFGSVGQSAFTAYAIFLTLRATDSYALAILMGIASSLVLSSLLAWLAIRMEDDAFGILSIALHLAILAVILNWTDLTRGTLGLPRIPRMSGLHSLPVFTASLTVIAVITSIVMYRIDRGPLGRALAALAENRFHAESMGIQRGKTLFLAFLVAGACSFLTSLFFAQYLGVLHPSDYQFHVLIFSVMCVVAGRPGSVWGVAAATFILLFVQELIRFLPLPFSLVGPLRLLVFGVVLLLCIFFRRETMFPRPRSI